LSSPSMSPSLSSFKKTWSLSLWRPAPYLSTHLQHNGCWFSCVTSRPYHG
jgi:hypothetical protein